ncbi:hypothetical protein K439DRAFT_1623607 [Ramaria rubella]|nr:hypothetical protein K439DRAFT_1623607 [Ramaria rubella]
MQEFLAFSRFVCVIPVKECLCLHHLGRADNHFRSKMIDPTLFQLFRAAGFPTRTGLAVDLGIQACPRQRTPLQARLMPAPVLLWELADPNPPRRPLALSPTAHSPACGALASAVQALRWHVNPLEGGPYFLPPPAPTSPSSAGRPVHDAAPLWLPVGWPNVRIPDVPDPLLSSPALPCANPQAPPHTGADVCGRAATTEARPKPTPGTPPEQTGALSLWRSPWRRRASRALEPTPPFDTLDLALLHVIQHATCLGGLSPGEHECVVARLRGMPVPPQGFLGVVAHLRLLADQTSLAPWDFDPQGDGVLPWLLLWVCVLISWVREDMRVAPGSDHRGVIVNMYLELSRMEWWALSDRREVLSEWCKGASMPV